MLGRHTCHIHIFLPDLRLEGLIMLVLEDAIFLATRLATLYTCWTAPRLTFDLLCRSRMMLDEAKLSPTSASIYTTNQMLGEALSNKCFIMPKSLNDNTKIELALDKYLAARMSNIFKLITYWIRTHDGSQICCFVLIDLQILQRKFFRIRNLVVTPKARTEK